MGKKASGKHSYGFCDLTGFRYPTDELVQQYEDRRPTGLFVGADMVDVDNEQLKLDELRLDDPKSLENPRPDTALAESRRLSAWNPVGGGQSEFGSRTLGLDITVQVGQVTVETS